MTPSRSCLLQPRLLPLDAARQTMMSVAVNHDAIDTGKSMRNVDVTLACRRCAQSVRSGDIANGPSYESAAVATLWRAEPLQLRQIPDGFD
ncbi:hypothetical protein C7S18_10410 [Ahniella affigens]|uniref:Uncharacterized protein n=1 Tax=Ahniella affigens TaxID=2021234 RepID=A0A2P1PRW1_9GAMM|nr:hypothetical protein C7S18_10410 [Ahniella affigens]